MSSAVRIAATVGLRTTRALWANFVMVSRRAALQGSTWDFRQSCSPLRFVSEQGDELVRRSKATFAQVWWNDGLDGFELFAGITACVDFGGRQVAVSEPQGHLADVLCRVQHDHRG